MGARSPWVLLVMLGLVGSAEAQDPTPLAQVLEAPEEEHPLILGDGSSISSHESPQTKAYDNDSIEEPERLSLSEYLPLNLPTLSEAGDPGFVSQVSLRRMIPGSVVIKYRGLHGFVMKRIQRRYRSQWRKQIRELDKRTYLTLSDRRRLYREMNDAKADMRSGGRWWERKWYDSLPEAKGGAPTEPFVQVIGKRITFFEVGPVRVTNDLRLRFNKWVGLDIDPDPSRVHRAVSDGGFLAREMAHIERRAHLDPEDRRALEAQGIPEPAAVMIPLEDLDLSVDSDAEPPWFSNLSWRFKLRPGARASLRSSTIKGSLAMRLVGELYRGRHERKLKVAKFQIYVRYRPMSQELETSIEVALLSW